jgi:hypothetical protein
MNVNTEFEWRGGMRKLGGSVEPARDLWPHIAAQIATGSGRRHRMQVAFAIAATLVIAFGAGLVARRGNWQTLTTESRLSSPAPSAMAWAQPRDVKLAAAARDLDDASAQLQQALEQHPDAVFLVGLLNRANGQRMRLLRQTSYTGA